MHPDRMAEGVAELVQCEMAGELAQCIEVPRELEIALRSSLNVDSAKYKDFVWCGLIEDECLQPSHGERNRSARHSGQRLLAGTCPAQRPAH